MQRELGLLIIVYRYFTTVFVSLGVFLFGYDQGVMSGIITYVDAAESRSARNITDLDIV